MTRNTWNDAKTWNEKLLEFGYCCSRYNILLFLLPSRPTPCCYNKIWTKLCKPFQLMMEEMTIVQDLRFKLNFFWNWLEMNSWKIPFSKTWKIHMCMHSCKWRMELYKSIFLDNFEKLCFTKTNTIAHDEGWIHKSTTPNQTQYSKTMKRTQNMCATFVHFCFQITSSIGSCLFTTINLPFFSSFLTI
jgi:hypothetical protein